MTSWYNILVAFLTLTLFLFLFLCLQLLLHHLAVEVHALRLAVLDSVARLFGHKGVRVLVLHALIGVAVVENGRAHVFANAVRLDAVFRT